MKAPCSFTKTFLLALAAGFHPDELAAPGWKRQTNPRARSMIFRVDGMLTRPVDGKEVEFGKGWGTPIRLRNMRWEGGIDRADVGGALCRHCGRCGENVSGHRSLDH
jgi:hypothetical protein